MPLVCMDCHERFEGECVRRSFDIIRATVINGFFYIFHDFLCLLILWMNYEDTVL